MFGFVIFILILVAIDLYAFMSVKRLVKSKIILIIYALLSLGVIANFAYRILSFRQAPDSDFPFMYAFGMLILSIVPKLVIIPFLFLEDVVRVLKWILGLFRKKEPLKGRRAFVSKIALGIASIPFASILYGITKGRYNFKVIKHTLFFEDLPANFDGFTITHISDIHSGSFDNKEKVNYGVDLINEQESDLILFTGDLVNNTAQEMDPWIDVFKRLRATYGKYSVLGNHDYGDYARWMDKAEKAENFKKIKALHPKIGFNLLLNESVYINKGVDKIALIGVENWGVKFKKAGDIKKATEKNKKEDFKVLMSHDPSHWDSVLKKDDQNFHLTLSGHTHGMQFGIEIPGIKWSPVKYLYKQWAGIYQEKGRFLNVNRGFGYLAFPGRVGIWPEITVITLKKKPANQPK